MDIKPAEKTDLETLVKLYKETIYTSKHRIDTYFLNHIRDGNVYVLYENNKLIGAYVKEISRMENSITKRLGKQKSLWLQQIMVWPEYHHLGYGRALLKHFISQSKGTPMRLQCKTKLVLYYMQFGFIVIERNLYGNPSFVENIMYLKETKGI